MGNLPEPIYLNVEYLFFLIYRIFKGIVTFFKSLFVGFRGDNQKLRSFYTNTNGTESCNPFLGDICSQTTGSDGVGLFGSISSFGFGLHVFLVLLTLLLLFVIIYSIVRWTEIKNESDRHIESLIPIDEGQHIENKQWQQVKELIASNNPQSWRIAILEADAMLEDMTKAMNIRGDTLGERLKSIEPSDFLTLQKAWEAHKIRNQIAHQGSRFVLEQRQALLAIQMYEEVFHEFKLI